MEKKILEVYINENGRLSNYARVKYVESWQLEEKKIYETQEKPISLDTGIDFEALENIEFVTPKLLEIIKKFKEHGYSVIVEAIEPNDC